jgi:hypothetical protein
VAKGGCTGKGFLPNQSGNPGGKSKNREELRRVFEKIALEDLELKGAIRTQFEWLIRRMFADALKGKSSAQREILDKCLGKDFHLTVDADEKLKGILEVLAGFGKNGSEE